MKVIFTLPMLILFTVALITVNGKPAVDEEPIRFTLDTKEDKINETVKKLSNTQFNPRVQSGMDWLGRTADALRFGRGRLVNSFAIARNIIVDRVEEIMNEAPNNVAGAIGAANDIVIKSRSNFISGENYSTTPFLPTEFEESAKIESQKYQLTAGKNKINSITYFLENILKPRPILDNIKEDEKYGNNGDKFIGVGRALVNGFEGLSNFFINVADVPVHAAKQTSRGITEALNQFGAKLVGLQ